MKRRINHVFFFILFIQCVKSIRKRRKRETKPANELCRDDYWNKSEKIEFHWSGAIRLNLNLRHWDEQRDSVELKLDYRSSVSPYPWRMRDQPDYTSVPSLVRKDISPTFVRENPRLVRDDVAHNYARLQAAERGGVSADLPQIFTFDG